VCKEYKEENHVARSYNNYWRWREWKVKRKLNKLKEKPVGEERVLKYTMCPLKKVWMMVGMEKGDTNKGVMVKVLLDSGTVTPDMKIQLKSNIGRLITTS